MMKRVSPAEAVAGKYPEWIVFIVTADPDAGPNLMPAGWCMFCSLDPMMVAVALGNGRHTAHLIEQTGQFNLAWAGAGQHEVVTYCGTHSGRGTNKVAELGLQTQPAAVNAVPLILGCSRALECELAGVMETGDHLIFVGEVVAAHVADPPIDNLVNFGGYYAPARPNK